MKILNVFAIVVAWMLSIVMVLMLVAAPLALSTLSLLEPENVMKIVSQMLMENSKSAEAKPMEAYAVQNLSAKTETAKEEKPAAENAVGGLKLDGIQGLFGDDVSEEVVNMILTSDAMEELLGAYTEDFANVIAGKNKQKEFTPELLVEVVQDNLDEIVEIVEKTSTTALTDEQKAQLKSQLSTAVEEKAEEIVAQIPAPEELKGSLVEGNKELESALTILAKKNEIKGAIVGMIVLISALIFGLRHPGLRGMRWLSTNLFTAGGFNVLISVVLGLASAALEGAAAGMNAMGGTGIDGVIDMLISQLAKGVIIRTVIIFVAAIALLVGYILLKPFVRKKKAAKMTAAGEEIVPEAIPGFVPAPVDVEPEVAAEEPVQLQETVAEESAEEPVPEEEI